MNKIVAGSLTVVFQFIDSIKLVSCISRCSKEFRRASQNPNSWRYSKFCEYYRDSRAEEVIKHMPMLRNLSVCIFREHDYGFKVPENLKYVPLLSCLDLSYGTIDLKGFSSLAYNLKFV